MKSLSYFILGFITLIAFCKNSFSQLPIPPDASTFCPYCGIGGAGEVFFYAFEAGQVGSVDMSLNVMNNPLPGDITLSITNVPITFWQGYSDGFFNFSRGKRYFFNYSTQEYIRVDGPDSSTSTVDAGYPKSISVFAPNWPVGFKSDAAVYVSTNDKSYFFDFDLYGNPPNPQYLRYNWDSLDIDPGYPKPINNFNSDWPLNFNSGTQSFFHTAVFNSINDKIYFFDFCNENYYRFDWVTNAFDPGYPKPMTNFATDWPQDWKDSNCADTTGIEDIQDKGYVEIFPNPVGNQFSLKTNLQITELRVRNMLGQEVFRKEENLKIIECSNLLTGHYIIEVVAEELILTKKLVKF